MITNLVIFTSYILSDYLSAFHVLNISKKYIIFENRFHGDDLEFLHGGLF